MTGSRMRSYSAPRRRRSKGCHRQADSKLLSSPATVQTIAHWKPPPTSWWLPPQGGRNWPAYSPAFVQDRKSVVEGKCVSVRVELGGRRIIKNKNYRQ